MNMYALIDSADSLVRLQAFDEVPPELAPEKGLRWLEWLETTPPEYNGNTHKLVEGLSLTQTSAAWSFTVEAIPAEEVAAALANAKTAFLARIDADVDAIYAKAIGNRGPEYEDAAAEAQAYKVAGYPATVPDSVAAWANAKGQTAVWAADDILTEAAKLIAAKKAIRTTRLLRKEQGRNAANMDALATVKAQWAGFVSALRAQMGL